jgi:hypothetical protein
MLFIFRGNKNIYQSVVSTKYKIMLANSEEDTAIFAQMSFSLYKNRHISLLKNLIKTSKKAVLHFNIIKITQTPVISIAI